MTTTPRLWNSLTQVNTTDGGTAQFDGEITPLQDGGYVVVWTDLSNTYNPQGGAIVGQRYDSAGNKIGGDPAHGGEVLLSLFPNGNQSRPAVTTLANGDIAVAYADLFSGNSDITVHIFDPSLHFVRTDLIEDGLAQTFFPSLTALADGSYVVSYTVGTGTHTEVVARTVSAAGMWARSSISSIIQSAVPRSLKASRISRRCPTATSWRSIRTRSAERTPTSSSRS